MRPGLLSRLKLRNLLLWSAPVAWLGCGGGGTDIVLPSLSVSTSTTGVELDPDGYSLVVDALAGQPIGLNATLVVDGLADGAHTVELSGVAANCAAQGDNPRSVTVPAGGTTNLAFAVTCSPTSGTIDVTTATSGPGADPDGFALILDGSDQGLIGVSATAAFSGITPGPHSVGLSGLAANCQVVGENPRSVTVTAGQTAQVPFAVTCAQPPSSTGSVQITTATSGNPTDPDGYILSVDGGAGQAIGTNASVTLAGFSVGTHSVRLNGMAANCQVSGQNPRSVSVTEGQTTAVSFTITCAADTGGLTVTVSGLPSGTAAAVTVAGPNGFSQTVTATEALTGLAPGSYTVSATSVTDAGTTYTPSVDRPTVSIGAGATAAVTVTYRPPAGATLNLRIEGFYLTQSTQTLNGSVPLVQDRDAFLRVFVVASESNTAKPSVRVRFSRNGTVLSTLTIAPSDQSTPTSVQEATLGSSWNIRVPGSLIQPGVAVLADVDPTNAIREADETDNTFPASSTPAVLSVQAVPTVSVRFVPVLQSANGLQGAVGNTDGLMEPARRMYPLQTIQTDLHAVYTATGPLQANNENNQWNQILSEIEALRVAENSTRTYYGMVKLDYSAGIVGVGFVGNVSTNSPRAAIGWDDPSDVGRVVAHELGHTWGQLHTPCGNPPNIDPNYPYTAGNIGVYGYDVTGRTLKSSSSSDIMGYCSNPWISDYTYQHVLAFRQGQPAAAATAASAQPCLLLWGHIENGRPVLEPAFHIVTRPSLPAHPGPYSIEAVASDGTRLMTLSFDATAVADDPRGNRHFAFAVPLDQARAARLGSLRLTAPGGAAAAMSLSMVRLPRPGMPDSVESRREAGGVALKWNASAHPMIMVRDPDTGEVLSFARGGDARVGTSKAEVDLEVSDGVRSHRERLAISRP